ncbi:MAG: lipopolysaccharide biosynthesis protein [Phyllobacteriaceae bacterium]|nr:lipopolysaccharide biosynthesis protein [Phyllobacteriaceae bacterium]
MTGRIDFDDESRLGSETALDRAKKLSQALSDAARKARFSTRSRNAMAAGGFGARRGARLMTFLTWGAFVVLVAVPVLAASIYFGIIASDQYVVETRFTVMGGEIPNPDNLGKFSGVPAMAIVQDTQIVTNYIHTRAAVEKLEQRVGLRELYSRPETDFAARFDPSEPIEQFVRYWEGMSKVSIGMPSGIVDLQVRAFSATDGVNISRAILKVCEELINELNDRMNGDAVRAAERELQTASQRLAAARGALEKARNEEGVLDAGKSGDAMTLLITGLKGSLLQMQKEYDSSLRVVSESAPQMRAFRTRIETTRAQIAELEAQLTSTGSDQGRSLSQAMSRFSTLDLERQIAERLYTGAASALEVSRLVAERKMMYLNVFVEPVAPQEPRLPRRVLYPLVVLVGSLVTWGVLIGLATAVRNNMA